jgi:glycosyltransferase involved in cell wall biosynthesis
VEDKSQVSGWKRKLILGLRWLLAYPILIYRYLRMPDHDAVLVCYMGQLDTLLLWPWATLRRKPILWDAFLSLYDTVVEDRRIAGTRHPLALGLYAIEWLACRAANRVILDTEAHGAYFATQFRIPPERVTRVFVGAETDIFHYVDTGPHAKPNNNPLAPRILFYGQFIPLHGIEYIVRAAKLCEHRPFRWVLIGKGQESDNIRNLIADLKPANVEWIEWIPYHQIVDLIRQSDICLGIFGETDKALRVIPNKVFQILATGNRLITMDSPAARELLVDWPGVSLISPANPQALADAVCRILDQEHDTSQKQSNDSTKELAASLSPRYVSLPLVNLIAQVAARAA